MVSFRYRIVPWHLVFLGILLNIFSAVLTNGMIDEKNQQIAAIESESERMNQRINELWQQVQQSERKRELFLQLYGTSSDIEALPEALRDYLLALLEQYRLSDQPLMLDLHAVMKLFNHYQTPLRDQIDTVWLEMMDKKEPLGAIHQEVSNLRSLALFLQLLGLILILSRDLSRKSR